MYDGLTESSDFDMSGAAPSHPSLSTATSEVPSQAAQSVTNQTMPVAGEAHPAHPDLPTTSAAEAPHLTSPVLPQTLQASDLPTVKPPKKGHQWPSSQGVKNVLLFSGCILLEVRSGSLSSSPLQAWIQVR